MTETMSKTQVRAWIKRCREDLRDAEQALREGKGEDLYDTMLDAVGAATEVMQAADEHRVRGMGW